MDRRSSRAWIAGGATRKTLNQRTRSAPSIYPLITALLKDPDVLDALYYTGHPQLDKPVLTVKVKKGSPQAALQRVAEGLAAEFAGAKGLLEKELA
jgi:hypothetical protein